MNSWVDSQNESAIPSGSQRWAFIAAILMFLAGGWCLRGLLQSLWEVWSGDALRSIGMLVPPISLALALRAWSREDWRQGGTWWGLPLAGIGLVLGTFVSGTEYSNSLVASTFTSIRLFPVGLIVCAYVSGTVLLFGGTRAWRKAAFPLLLLLCVNPVPRAFTTLFDLPLQHLGASTARGFAALLHVPVSSGTLQMMFAPDLGMFIAPGCDGFRGASAMGYMALVTGYVYKMPRLRWLAYVLAAIATAFVFNLIRLCCVVIYYWVALRVPSIDDLGTQVDYVIGGTLFPLAITFILGVPARWGRPHAT